MQHVCIRCNTKRSFPWHPDPPVFLVWAWSDDNCKHERLVQTISHILHKRFVCEEFPFHPKPLSPPTCFASSLFFSSAFFSTTLHLLPLLLHSLVPGLSSSLHSFHGHGWEPFCLPVSASHAPGLTHTVLMTDICHHTWNNIHECMQIRIDLIVQTNSKL